MPVGNEEQVVLYDFLAGEIKTEEKIETDHLYFIFYFLNPVPWSRGLTQKKITIQQMFIFRSFVDLLFACLQT